MAEHLLKKARMPTHTVAMPSIIYAPIRCEFVTEGMKLAKIQDQPSMPSVPAMKDMPNARSPEKAPMVGIIRIYALL